MLLLEELKENTKLFLLTLIKPIMKKLRFSRVKISNIYGIALTPFSIANFKKNTEIAAISAVIFLF
jgi:hypothetical protein